MPFSIDPLQPGLRSKSDSCGSWLASSWAPHKLLAIFLLLLLLVLAGCSLLVYKLRLFIRLCIKIDLGLEKSLTVSLLFINWACCLVSRGGACCGSTRQARTTGCKKYKCKLARRCHGRDFKRADSPQVSNRLQQ